MKELIIYLINSNEISLETLLESFYLSPIEKESFEKYKVESVKKEKIVSYYLKKKYVGSYEVDVNGKPISNHKYFNISHSHGYVVLVIDDAPIGIDVETIRPVNKSLVDVVTNKEEKEYVYDDASFYEVWTNKEALVKAYGSGIKQRPDTIPGLPVNGVRSYKDKLYFNRSIRYQDVVISVSRQSSEDYSIKIETITLL